MTSQNGNGRDVFYGCLYTMFTAAVTGVLLFVNGSLVMAFVLAYSQSSDSGLLRPGIAQFILLSVPVLMVVVEWKMIDYVRERMTWGRRT